MRIAISTNNFKTAMEKAYKCVDKKNIMPVLQNLLVHIEQDNSYIAGTNLDNWVISNIQIDNVAEPIDFVFGDTVSLFKAMKFFNDDNIVFNIQDGKVVISCGGKQTAQIIFNGDDFAPIPQQDITTAQEYKYNVKNLKERFNLIKYAAAKNDIKPIMAGIHFSNNDMVTLDGYRVAINTSDTLNIVVPFTAQTEGLNLMTTILDGDIDITATDKYIGAFDGNATVISRLYVGNYLDYKQAIPNNSKEIKIDVAEYTETLKYFKAFKTDNKIQNIAWLNNNLMLIGTDTRAELNTFKGEFQSAIGFNNQFMLEALAQFKTDDIKFNINSSVTPIVINDNIGNLALILPVRITNKTSEIMRELNEEV